MSHRDVSSFHTLTIPFGAIRHDSNDGNGLTGDVSPVPTSETIECNCHIEISHEWEIAFE